MKKREKTIFFILGLTLIFIVWSLFSRALKSDIIMPSVKSVFTALVAIITTKEFYTHFFFSISRVFITFSIAIILSSMLAITGSVFKWFNYFLMPLVSIIRTMPLLPLILIALIWFSPNYVPVFVSLLMIFPIIYNSIVTAMKEIDSNLLEMATSYNVSKSLQIKKLYVPLVLPYFVSACSMAMGITWKSILAAEIISLPKYSIGILMYTSHQYLETANMFAYCIIALMLNAFFEIIIRIVKIK